MKSMIQKLLMGGVISFFAASSAFANVTYTFDFSDLNAQGGSIDPFQISLTYSDYVTVTGLTPLTGAPYATTLGYSVNYAGTNSMGWWAFDDDLSGFLDDSGFSFGGLSFLAGINNTGYITAPGVYTAWGARGNVPMGSSAGGFYGSVVLTVTDDSVSVPEPASAILFAVGLLGLGVIRKRNLV